MPDTYKSLKDAVSLLVVYSIDHAGIKHTLSLA